MSTNTLQTSTSNALRVAIGIGGIAALIVGLLVLIWPSRTAMVVAAIIAVYAIVTGVAYAASGLFSRRRGTAARVGHVLLGVVYVIAGILAFSNLGTTAAALGVLLGILVGIMWIIEGVVALTTLSASRSKIWTILFAALSIIAGVFLLFSPLYGAMLLFWVLGLVLVGQGVVNIVRALTLGPDGTNTAV